MKFSSVIGKDLKVLDYSGGCNSCPRKLRGFVPSTIKDTKMIVVGEAPGENEVEQGEGFVGKTGQFLRKSFGSVGITEDTYSLTNIIHCRPPDNRDPTKTEISCCMNQYTIKEVTGYPVVVLVGRIATKAFFPNERFKNLRNNVVWHPDFPGQKFFPIYHPGYITRNKTASTLAYWNKSMKRLARVLDDEQEKEWRTYTPSDSVFEEKLEEILSNKTICFDIETNQSVKSWDPNSRIISLSLCVNDKEAIFVHEEDLVWKSVTEKVGQALEDENKVFIGHNIGFDIDFPEMKLNVHAKCKFLCTQSLFYISRNEKMPSLKYLTSKYLDGYKYLISDPGSCEDLELLANYNCEDVIRTWQLAKKELPNLTKKQKDLLLRVASPSNVALRRLTSTGFLFNREECKRTHKKVVEEKEKIVELWKEYDPKFDPDKHLDGDGLIWYLYTHRGLPVLKYTDAAKKPSTDKHTLTKLYSECEEVFLKWLERIKTLDKFENTYIEKYLYGDRVDFDGRVHSDYFNTWTKTGRSSSRNPNAQNITRDDTLQKTNIEGISTDLSGRKFFTVKSGNVLFHADYSQIELRIAMCLSKDPVGIQAYLDEGDLHWSTARMIAAGENREATKLDRTHAKPTNFGLVYTHKNEAYTLRKNAANEYGLILTKKKSERYSDTFFNTYQKIRPWQLKTIQRLRAGNGVIETVMGFPAKYPDYNSRNDNARDAAEREAINLMCQSPAGFMTLYTLYLFQQKVREYNLPIDSVASVHDSIMASVPQSRVETTIEIMEECVSVVKEWVQNWFIVPLVMEYEIGPNWSQLEELDITSSIT